MLLYLIRVLYLKKIDQFNENKTCQINSYKELRRYKKLYN